MSVHETEEQQIEAIKKWWKENGKAVITGVVLGAAVLFGGQTWMKQKAAQAEAASILYDQLIDDLRQDNKESALEGGEKILAGFPNSPYAAMSSLALAKLGVEEGELAAAKGRLQWVLDHANQPDVLHVARLRLARIMLSDGQASEALALLTAAVDVGKFQSAYEELKGDIYQETGQTEKARLAYNRATNALPEGSESRLLQAKLAALGQPSMD